MRKAIFNKNKYIRITIFILPSDKILLQKIKRDTYSYVTQQ